MPAGKTARIWGSWPMCPNMSHRKPAADGVPPHSRATRRPPFSPVYALGEGDPLRRRVQALIESNLAGGRVGRQERGRAQPHGSAILFVPLPAPESHVLSPLGALAVGLFKGQILFAAEYEQVADRSLVVLLAAQHGLGDFQ